MFSLSGALNAFIGRPNRKIPRLAPAAGVALVAFAAACGDAPSAPTATALAPADARSLTVTSKVSNTLATVTGLLWTNPVTEATATKVIGPAGGSFSIANGIQVTVPPNAVSQNVTFSVTRVAGSIVAYDFQPHGTTFAKPLVIMQPTLGTNLFKLDPATSVEGAYFSSLNQTSGTALVSEFEPTFVSADRAWVTFTVKHFSGYIIASGRQ